MRIRVLAPLVLLALAWAAPAHATFPWRHYNVDPFAPSREEAMEKREKLFTDAGLSKVCVAAAVEATKTPGKEGRLIKGDRLNWMASSGGHVNRDVLVDLVNVDPGVEASPLTEEWTVTCDGWKLTIILPQACNNWSGRMVRLPKPKPRPRRHIVYREVPPPQALPMVAAPPPPVSSAYPYQPFPPTECIRRPFSCPN